MSIESVQIIISGKVQNVGFRFHTYKKAKQMDIKGYVKNSNNGSVYIEAEAENILLNEFISWCKQGPDWARVIETNVLKQPVCGYKQFEIRK